MPLRDPGFESFRVNFGFGFTATDGVAAVVIYVTDRAVSLIRPSARKASQARFEAYRPRFLAAASTKFDRGEVSSRRHVWIDAADVT